MSGLLDPGPMFRRIERWIVGAGVIAISIALALYLVLLITGVA